MAKAQKALTKTQVLTNIAEKTGLSKKDIGAVFEALSDEIQSALGKGGPQAFTIPGLIKITKKHVDAKPARKGVPNPFKPGELMDVAAKDAYDKVVVRALKALKDMA